jgi:hypothetical protein
MTAESWCQMIETCFWSRVGVAMFWKREKNEGDLEP